MRVAPILGIALLAGLLIAACTTKHWTKRGATYQEFHQDSYVCAQEARQSHFRTGGAMLFGPGTDALNVNKELYRACMGARGYQRVNGGEWVGIRD